VIGSVAGKLVEKLTHVPLWVVGGKDPEPGRFLLALDASKGAVKAVHHVGTMLGGSNSEVTLLHVIRRINIALVEDEDFIPSELKQWLQKVNPNVA
jgi:hypothetical protein